MQQRNQAGTAYHAVVGAMVTDSHQNGTVKNAWTAPNVKAGSRGIPSAQVIDLWTGRPIRRGPRLEDWIGGAALALFLFAIGFLLLAA